MRTFHLAVLFGAGLPVVAIAPMQSADAQARAISVSGSPTIVIGDNEKDESTIFGVVIGATKLPDGRILVADRGDYALRTFSSQGKLLKSYAPKGSGPGEIRYAAEFFRCGSSVFVRDIENGNRVAEYSLDLTYKRMVAFKSVVTTVPYKSECNAAGKFLHYDWERRNLIKGGVFRTHVPFWFSDADDLPPKPFGEFPGSERWGQVQDKKVVGSGPLPFGKQTVIAIGSKVGYIGLGNSYEILVYDFAGKQTGVIRDASPLVPVTKADVAAEIELQGLNKTEAERKAIEREYAAMELPKTFPAYKALVVDAMDLLWVQDYPRLTSKTVRWSVFTSDGKLVSRVTLPSALQILEVGRDFLLARYLDTDVEIPQVRLYTLTR